MNKKIFFGITLSLILIVILNGCGSSGPGGPSGPSDPLPSNDTSLIAYYPFNGNAHDGSQVGNDGVPSGSGVTYIADHLLQTKKAIHFDGTAGMVIVSNFGHPLTNNSFSIAFWLERNTASTVKFIICDNFQIFSNSGADVAIQVGINGFVYWLSSSYNTVLQNTWTHVVITYDGSDLNIYLNGNETPVATSYHPGLLKDYSGSSNGKLIFGNDGQANYWQGSIDDFRIYNRVLATSEIADLYNLKD